MINLRRYLEIPPIEIKLGFSDEAKITVNGRTQVFKNIITDEGLTQLKSRNINTLLAQLMLGNGEAVATAADMGSTFIVYPGGPPGGILVGPWEGVSDPCTVFSPFQWRTLQGFSTYRAGIADTATVAPDFTYVDFKRTWVGEYARLFGGAEGLRDSVSGPADPSWITEMALGLNASVSLPVWICEGGNQAEYFHDTAIKIWNRWLLTEPFEFEPATELTVEYTLRLNVPTVGVVDNIVVGGVNRVVTSRAYRPDVGGRWNPFWFGYAPGLWPINGNAIFDSNVMPALNANIAASFAYNILGVDMTRTSGAGNWYDYEFRIPPAAGNFAGGVGALTHFAIDTTAPAFISTFNPKLVKTTEQRLILNTRYSWARVSGD
jgi:hypothetical protein